MKIRADDWHFRCVEGGAIVFDIFLSNAQHALLEAYPMKHPESPNGQIPELVVFCEMPGEKIAAGGCVARWITRPPDRSCPWSNVELPPSLMVQIQQRLGMPAAAEAAPAA